MFLVAGGADHLDGVLVGEDGEVGLRFEEQNVASLVVATDALDAVARHGDVAFAVGEGEEFVAGAVEDGLEVFVSDEFLSVAQEDDGLGLALGGHAGDVVDGDEGGGGGGDEDFAVVHHAVVPAFLDDEVAVFEVAVVAVFESAGVVAFACEIAVFVVFHEASFDVAVDIVGCDVAVLADALPPASVAAVVLPEGHLGGVAAAVEDDVSAVLDAHAVGGFLDEASVFGEEAPESVAVALVVFAAGEEVSLLVVGLVEATAAGFGVGVADADGAVVIVVGEGAGLEAVLEVALEDFGAVLVGADPVALAAALFVDLVLGSGAGGGEHQGCSEEKNALFHW